MLLLRKFLCAQFVIAVLLIFGSGANAEERLLNREFDARELIASEKKFLQAALAFQGFYNGLLDGKWGRGSQGSLERYTRARFSSEPLMVHAATLAFDFFELQKDQGWQIQYFPKFQTSLAFPKNVMELIDDSENFSHWNHVDSRFQILISSFDYNRMSALHRTAFEGRQPNSEPYILRKDDLWVSSVRKSNGGSVYIRSHLIRGRWVVVYLDAESDQKSMMNGVSSSISVGYDSRLAFPQGGVLDQLINATINWLEKDENPEPDAVVVNRPPDKAGSLRGTGSGFFVSPSNLLTNAHVVESCGSLRVGDKLAKITAFSSDFDLAVLEVSGNLEGGEVATFAATSPELNSDITVVGFPLSGLLGGLNVTRGAVASLKGLAGDYSTIQISAPVQSGNSGGPVLNHAGNIVGVVVSKLDAKKFADDLGEIPQNINFAIRGEIAKLFLSANQIEFEQSSVETALSPVELAKKAVQFTVRIECYS